LIAILSGLGAATVFAASVLAATVATRRIGPGSTVAWVMLVGLPIAVVAAAADTTGLSPSAYPWLAAAGMGNVIGLGFEYAALRIGRVGVVAPLTSTEGAVAALLSIAGGTPLTGGLVLGLGIVATGGALTAASAEPAGDAVPSGPRYGLRSVALALLAAVCFGSSLYAAGRVSQALPLGWVLLPARFFGVLLVTIPLAATGRLKLERAVVPALLVSGLAEVIGFLCIGIGSRTNIAITSVLASQFAAFAAIGAVLLFGERLSRLQKAGIVAIALGTALVAALAAS
jgi:drug/metabolite transporter (DMT)-like permease